jgi:hypothetical protein
VRPGAIYSQLTQKIKKPTKERQGCNQGCKHIPPCILAPFAPFALLIKGAKGAKSVKDAKSVKSAVILAISSRQAPIPDFAFTY